VYHRLLKTIVSVKYLMQELELVYPISFILGVIFSPSVIGQMAQLCHALRLTFELTSDIPIQWHAVAELGSNSGK
jgi:hypothetical protein